MLRFIGIGDNVVDQYRNINIMFPGGNTVNFAAYVRQFGIESAYMGVLGSDGAAAHILSVLTGLGVDVSHCRQVEGENGYAAISLENGDRVFIGHNFGGVQSEHPLTLTEDDFQYVKSFDLLLTHTSIAKTLPISNFQRFRRDGVQVAYDFSNRWTDEQLNALCPYLNFGFFSCSHMSENDLRLFAEEVFSKGTPIVVCTRGSEGAMLYNGEHFFTQQAFSVNAIDTLGAGDSFISAFLCSYLTRRKEQEQTYGRYSDEKHIIEEAMKSGSIFAAETCMVHGAFGHGTEIVQQGETNGSDLSI